MKRHIPNFLTCLNLLSGCIAIVFALKGELTTAAWLVFIAGVFDFFDGFAARLLKVHSPIGKELDSLADIVSFGVVPSTIVYTLFLSNDNLLVNSYWAYSAFLIAVFSALRLAKFNIDERQQSLFMGLPTPANGIMICALPFIVESYPKIAQLIQNPLFLMFLIVVTSFLMVAPIPLLALKFKPDDKKGNMLRYSFLIVSALLIILFKFAALPIVVFLYVAVSLLFRKTILKTTL